MGDNKLYNALLKSQEARRRSRNTTVDEPAIDTDEYIRRPVEGSDPRKPGSVHVDMDDGGYPPTIYDASVSLELIDNPKPWRMDQLRERKIIFPGMSNKSVMDAYRELRIQLRNQSGGQRSTILYSSLGNGECSALTAFNLAAAFALDSGTSALLIDCNPYGSDLQHLVSSKMGKGITDYVQDSSLAVSDILYPSGIDRLTVIPAGTQVASAVELYASTRMRDLLAELQNRYMDRCIILNAPPFRESTESRILVRFANQVVFGVPFGCVTQEDIVDSVESLGSNKFSGVVFQE